VCAVIAPITLGKPSIASNCGLMLAWEFDIPAEMRIILSHSAGMARLRVDWHSPNRLASSFWNAPVARNPSHALVPTGDVHTCGHKRMAPRCCAPTPAAALRTVPGGLPSKRLMNQLSSCASKSSLSLNTRSLPVAPFAMSTNTAKAGIVFNGMHCNTLHMLLYPLV